LTLTFYEKEGEILNGIYQRLRAKDTNMYYTSGHPKGGGDTLYILVDLNS
jgi:hypothetical protein